MAFMTPIVRMLCCTLALAVAPTMAETRSPPPKSSKPPKTTAARTCTPPAPASAYVLGDSLGYGLKLAGLEVTLRALLRGPQMVSFDGGRSITTPGAHIKKTALESVDMDAAFIRHAKVVIIVLGTNILEANFTESQTELLKKLKALAPSATYYWVDIAATMSTYAQAWSDRNQLIYGNANALGYQVISRYKAIFGPDADPLHIRSGWVFPGMASEPGYGGEGSIHGKDIVLSEAIVDALLPDLDRITGGFVCR